MYPQLPSTLLIISLKMYFPPSRTVAYLRDLLPLATTKADGNENADILLALIPDFLTLYPCAQILSEHNANLAPANAKAPLLLGAQDCFWESLGAYTGEVSPLALRDIGASIVELGHAERRAIFGETDEQVALKAKAACAHGLVPLVCVGEVTSPSSSSAGADERAAVRNAVDECAVQVHPILNAIPADAPVIFAYEPVWAIGQPVPAGVGHVSAVVDGVRGVIAHVAGARSGQVRVLYGGSAGPGLWGKGGLGKAVDGMFLGRFAHEVEGVRNVVQEVKESV